MTASAFNFGLDFRSASERLQGEEERRRALVARLIPFHVQFLDDALGGILPNDLVLLGARTGSGKTALATAIAQETARAGKRVTYFALEAEVDEIERRMKYRALSELLHQSESRLSLRRLSYRNWYLGKIDDLVGKFNAEVHETLEREYKSLITFYRGTRFTGEELDRSFMTIQDQTDLIILDHLHYVDTEDTDENRGYKEVVKRIRDTSLTIGVPVIVIAHLRKRDRARPQLLPDIDDFHGTSDITKIATKVILLAPAPEKSDPKNGVFGTYMHIPKDRMDGFKRDVAVVGFDARRTSYVPGYALGRILKEEWTPLAPDDLPYWAERAARPEAL